MSHTRLLAVDLDGTLIRSDMLLESWWNVASGNALAAARALLALPRGKAAFKEVLARESMVDPASLPYNPEVLDLIEQHRKAGGRVALVTATDRRLAQQVADHLGVFDEVHASDGDLNLKGTAKANFLIEHYGEAAFDYAGDNPADLEVWKHASRTITVDAPMSLRTATEAQSADVLHLGDPGAAGPSRSWLKALRPHQWAKNILIFLPMIMAHALTASNWFAAIMAFVTFSMVASSVYLLNDLLDLAADRAHPRKRNRPLPSGKMKLLHGSLLAPALLLGGVLIAVVFLPMQFVGILIGYFALTTAYSLSLKRQLVIDICTLAGLYTLRIIAGAVATDVSLSPWLLAFSSFLFLSLAAIKRQAELTSDIQAGRAGASGRAYLTTDLPIVSGMALTSGYVAVLVMALYVSSPVVTVLYKSPLWMWFTCPVLLFWISRNVMLTHRGQMDDDPVVFAFKDSTSRICAGLLVAITLVATYL